MNQPATTPTANILAARATCRELLALLTEENAGLQKHDVALVEVRIQHKKRLTLRLEQLLAEIRQKGSLWKSDASAKQQANLLAEEIKHFQEIARGNAMMLKVAHQLRADLIMSIRDTVEANQPRAQLYGANGLVSSADANTRLVARSI